MTGWQGWEGAQPLLLWYAGSAMHYAVDMNVHAAGPLFYTLLRASSVPGASLHAQAA